MQRRHSLVVELQLPKLAVRVRFPLPAPKILQKKYPFLQYFLSIAKAMAYPHALAYISSPKVHIISLRLYFLSQ